MTGPTIQDLLTTAAARLTAAEIDQPWREARLLLAEATGAGLSTIIAWPERTVGAEHAARFEAWLRRRLDHEPISRILGRREFWSLPFIVTAATLDPRPDSETLVEAVLAAYPDRERPYRVVDFGTGTGCLLLALLSEYPNARGLGVDRSEAAALVARANAEALGLASRADFDIGNWDSGLENGFDIVISNPPYIPTRDLDGLMPAVRLYDPRSALDGGADGLDPYRVLSRAAARLLVPGGGVFFEVGEGQAEDVARLLTAAGLSNCDARCDLAGIARVVSAKSLGPSQK